MDVTAGLDYVRANQRAVLLTRKRDGEPQLSPVTVAVDPDQRVIIS
ncbi:MAG: hypothetical protein QOJ19_204, partial [Acidimicrobiia bacterium]|nr:hypothetical protein [Acidimicrobiia bacterium]